MKLFSICCLVLEFALAGSITSAQITTLQYDNSRTGSTLHEKTLTPQNVNQFGKLGSFKVMVRCTRSRYSFLASKFPARVSMTCSSWPRSKTASMPLTRIVRRAAAVAGQPAG